MNKTFFLTTFILITSVVLGQEVKLMDNLLYPRLDSTYWNKDNQALNANYSKTANRCQTCVFQQTDTTRGRFCVNTSLGQVQLDTALHNFSPEKLVGKWEVINYGQFEVTDSILPDSKLYYRSSKILSERKDNNGYITFTEKRFKTSLIDNKEIPNKNIKYKILDGKFLTTKSLGGYCGATIIGITKEGYLIIDDHTYRTLALKGKYLIVKTSIRRMILKKSAAT
ncbi:MAG: hypothetical protein JWO09_2102 [Bacteroidetes bacterium]|nr:hypothetical protein [Bacteroidota bacterium]